MLPRELGGKLTPGCTVTSKSLTCAWVLVGVVDPLTLKVHGTDNLRVVDASLMPMLIATHPQSTVYAIAERVSMFTVDAAQLGRSDMPRWQASDIIRGRIFGF